MAGSSRGGSKYPNVATEYAYHGLHDACASGNVGLAKYALSAGQPVNSVLDGVLPIHAACAGGSDAVVRLLLSNGADVNAVRLPRKKPHRHKLDKLASPTSLKGSSLAMAGTSASGSSSAVPTHPTIGGSGATPLHFAAANGHTHIVGLLLGWGAKAEAIDKHGLTPVELAAEGGHDDVVSTLESWMAIHPSGSNQASPALVRQQVQAQLDAATPADLRGEVMSSRFGVHSHASRSNGSFGSTSGTGNGTTGTYDEFGGMGPGFASSAPREGSLRRTASAGGSLTLGARPLGTADVLRRIPSRGTTGSKESDHSTGTTSTGFLPPSPHRSRHNPHGPANPNYSPSDPLLPLPAASERRPSLPDISNPANIPPALLRGSRRPRSAGEDSDGGSGGFASMAAAVQAAPDGYVRVGRGLRKLGSKGGLLSLFRKPSGDLMALANSGMGASAAGNAAGKARQAPDSSDSELDDAEGDAGDVDSEGLSSLGPSTANTPSAWQTTFASSSTNGSQPDTSSNGSPVQSTLPREASESDMILASTHPYQAATVPGPRPRPRSVSSDLQLTGMSAPRPPMAALVTPSRAATTTTISTTPSRSTTLTSATTPSRSTTATSASSTTPSRSVTGTPGTASTARPIPPNNRGRKGSEVLAHSPLATEWRHAELSRQTSIDADDNEDVSDGEQGLRAVDNGLRAAMVDDKMLRPPLGRAELSAGSSFLQFDSRSNSSVGASPHAMEEQAEVASPEPMSAGFQQQQQQHPPTDRGALPPLTAATTAPIPVSRRRGGRPSTAESRTESSSMPSVFSGSPSLVSTGHSPGRPGPMRSPSPVRLGLRSPSPFRSGRAPSPHLRGAALNTSPGVRSRALPSNTSPGIRSRALPPSPSMRPKGLGSPALRANLTLSGSPPGHDGLVVPPSGMRMRSDSAESEVVAVGGSGNESGRSASGSVSSGGPGHQRRATDGQPPTYDGHTRAQSHDALGIVGGHYQAALNPNLSHTRPRRSTASLSFSSEESGTGSEALDDGPAPLRPTGKRLHSNSAASGGSSSGAGSVRRGARSPSASGFHPGISGAGNNSPTPDIRSHAQATALVAQTRAAILDAAEDEDDLELEEQLARLGETIELEKRFARGEAQRRVWGLREEDTPIVVGSPIERPRLAAASRTQSGGQANVKGTPPVTPSRLPTGGAPSEPATVATESTITPGATFRSPRTATLELGSQSIHVASPTPIGATLTLPSASPGKTSFGDPFMQNSSGALGLGLQVDVPPHRQAIALEVQPPSALPTPSTSPHPNDAHNGTIHGFGAAGELAGSASTNGSSGGSGIGLGGRTRTTSSTVGALPTSSSTSAAPASGTTSLGSKLGRIMSNSNANSSGDMSRWMGGASLTRVVTAPTTPSGEPPPMHGRKSSLTGSTMGDTVAPTAPSAGGGGGGLRSRLGGLRKVFGGGKGKA